MAAPPTTESKGQPEDRSFHTHLSESLPKRPRFTLLKEKDKTQPSDPHDGAAVTHPEPEDKPVPIDRNIHLSQGVLGTALTLFGHKSGIPGELPWVDAARLMSEMGFEGIKAGGSAWQFRPVSADALRVFKGLDAHISIHEPHPEKDVARRQISGIVRRLKRRLDLNEDHFVLGQRPTGPDPDLGETRVVQTSVQKELPRKVAGTKAKAKGKAARK